MTAAISTVQDLPTVSPGSRNSLADKVIASFSWAWLDIRCRYRRSMLGPFWETVNIFVLIMGMSYMSSAIFGGKVSSNLPYIGIGIILWSMLNGLVMEGTNAFVQHRDLIKNSALSIDIYAGRIVFRVFITSCHHLLLYGLGLIFFAIPFGFINLLALVGFVIVLINAYWVVMFLGLICARFRDLEMIVKNFMQLVFFVTPVFWDYHTMDPARHALLDFNPFFYFIEAVRAPLLGEVPPLQHYLVLAGITVFGYGLLKACYIRMRPALAFYV